jgi:hypothetical protein
MGAAIVESAEAAFSASSITIAASNPRMSTSPTI